MSTVVSIDGQGQIIYKEYRIVVVVVLSMRNIQVVSLDNELERKPMSQSRMYSPEKQATLGASHKAKNKTEWMGNTDPTKNQLMTQ